MTFRIDGKAVASGGRDDRLLGWERVQDLVGISRSTAWRLQRAGDFPKPVQLSPGRVGWWESELTAWKTSRGGETPAVRKPPRAPRLPGLARPVPTPLANTAPPPTELDRSRVPSRKRRRKTPIASQQIDFGF